MPTPYHIIRYDLTDEDALLHGSMPSGSQYKIEVDGDDVGPRHIATSMDYAHDHRTVDSVDVFDEDSHGVTALSAERGLYRTAHAIWQIRQMDAVEVEIDDTWDALVEDGLWEHA